MNYSKYNMERTSAPRGRTPWWIYAAAVIFAALIIWAAVKAFPGRKPKAETEEVTIEAPQEIAKVAPVTTSPPPPPPAPAPPPPAQITAPVAPPSAPPSAQTPPTAVGGPLQEAVKARERGDLVAARAAALEIWTSTSDAKLKLQAEGILNEVGIELVMSPREMPEKTDYIVQPGDSLDKIAKKFGTTIELLRAGNNIRGSTIRAGDRLRVLEGKFSVKVSKSRNDLELYLNDRFFKRYPVGTGEYNKTPVGDFKINDRIAQPTWWRPDGKAIPFGDPENLLGTHWLSIDVKGYGLHGTWEPETIGHQLSAGCVRMVNTDIEQLFTLLPLGTPVSIRD